MTPSAVAVEENCILCNQIRGRQYVEEIIDHIKGGFREAVHTSPLAKEPAYGLKINLVDITLHEDPVHRGPAQAIPMTWRPIYCCILLSNPKLMRALMSFECKVPSEYVSAVITMLNKRRGKILEHALRRRHNHRKS